MEKLNNAKRYYKKSRNHVDLSLSNHKTVNILEKCSMLVTFITI